MEYCITMEQTRRIAVWFNADSDEAAEEKALEIYHNTPAKDFEAGDDERDCTLYNKDTGKMVFDWAEHIRTDHQIVFEAICPHLPRGGTKC